MPEGTMEMLKDSVLVVAHPDDEALWFSSILEHVGRLVICYLDVPSDPNTAKGRERSLASHPIRRNACLGLSEAEVFGRARWKDPVTVPYGIEIAAPANIRRNYEANFERLVGLLGRELKGSRNVFTHNPWGEYGHEEHVQVYRAVRHLKEACGFALWYSNYCSNRSFPLMLRAVSGFDAEYATLPTNTGLANELKKIYRDNACWTWYDDYKWFDTESFMIDHELNSPVRPYGRIFPLNMLKMEVRDAGEVRPIHRRVLSRIRRAIVPNRDT
jgi:LmbE family N-acetylglucosaminyl deacetylase